MKSPSFVITLHYFVSSNSTFLQLTVLNSCPLPLVLVDHQLKTSIELVSLTGDKPTVKIHVHDRLY